MKIKIIIKYNLLIKQKIYNIIIAARQIVLKATEIVYNPLFSRQIHIVASGFVKNNNLHILQKHSLIKFLRIAKFIQ
jgi:hypothetical protein